MEKVEATYKRLLQPSDDLVADIAKIEGDIIILGVGGKMGPGLARVAKQAVNKAGINKKIIGVARFTEAGLQEELTEEGIETYKADLLNDDQLQALPEVENVLYLAGVKFGTQGNQPFTWAMNSYLPGRVAEKYKSSNIVVFSTGNVYPLVPVTSQG
ncbi:MAG: epimerase, partial [Ginsengibacter sp.]